MKTIKKIGLVSVVAFAMLAFSACDDSSSASSDETGVSSSSVETSDLDESSSSVDKKSSGNESTEKDKSSSSVKGSEPAEVSSSSAKETKNSSDSKSSSSVKTGGSSSSNKDKSSSSVSSSSSEITDYVGLPCEGILSDGNTGKIYLCVDGRYVLYVPTESSSSGPYEPFDQTLPLERLSEKYKTFTDSRNGRVYYYLTIVGRDTNYVKDSIQVMAQNLNIADVTLKGGENMTDDTKIERYCYNDDTTKCDRYGGLYQWAEMMGLNDSCNTRSCAHLIQENHQGICPKGWRIMNINDFQIALTSTDDHANGLRSGYIFSGSNKSGLSLTGSGAYFNQGGFADLDSAFYMFYPSESVFQDKVLALDQVISRYNDGAGASRGSKFDAHSVRCIKLK
ncbi:FISUMP domain-containing protein [Fibrobacter sp. UWEL]|uniref:FISUMP domain-containing protein n=1 Tax=Fibrobacter sp. UWEL TaxID=1896209 RepID=UPI00091A848F|nr:FISUMP domain-containing protein [Fibrobacter sp. UWEL]SHL53237.1 major paralogous domain-containing protein [Fibrobacter sp. UWEL]